MRSNSTDKEIRNFKIHSYYDNDNDNDSDNRDLNLLFDGRPSDDDERLKLDQAGREKKFSLLNFFRSKRDKIFNWFQSARNYINSLFSSSSNSDALINVRSDRGLNSENKNSEKLVSARNSADFSDASREYDHALDEYESRTGNNVQTLYALGKERIMKFRDYDSSIMMTALENLRTALRVEEDYERDQRAEDAIDENARERSKEIKDRVNEVTGLLGGFLGSLRGSDSNSRGGDKYRP